MSMITAMIMTSIFVLVIFIVSVWMEMNAREASSAFECGIETFSSSRNPFSVRFFMFMILFIIFDMEILLLIHFPFSWKMNILLFNKHIFIFFILMVLVLLVGTFFEKKQGALSWQE
uniref:NADH-ubiquinone oxidoreductase chain 3 n=1 Tax=Stenostomum leucops TaxID=52061 RepID=A0A1U9IW03_9PLAT|nr:NADH dehydrogenase subunit 3 [Stenostomum leucops]